MGVKFFIYGNYKLVGGVCEKDFFTFFNNVSV